jgi:hypothetical protein
LSLPQLKISKKSVKRQKLSLSPQNLHSSRNKVSPQMSHHPTPICYSENREEYKASVSRTPFAFVIVGMSLALAGVPPPLVSVPEGQVASRKT